MKLRRISVIAFMLAVGGLAVLIHNHALIASHPVAIAAQIAALLLMVWARLTLGRRSFHAAANPTEGELVTAGPYRYVRHPIYSAILLFTFAAVANYPGLWSFIAAIAVVAGTVVRIAAEENLLRAKYPEYEAYAASTRRVVPFIL